MTQIEDYVTNNRDELVASLARRNKFLRQEWYKVLLATHSAMDLIKERMKSHCRTARHITRVERSGLDIYLSGNRRQLIDEVKFLGKIYRTLNRGLEDE